MATMTAITKIKGIGWGIFLASVILFLAFFFLSHMSEIELKAESLKKWHRGGGASNRLSASEISLWGRSHPLINGEPIVEMSDGDCIACHTQLP